jgi:hypothetical protein
MAASNSRAKIGLGTKVIFTQSGWAGEICEPITGVGVERGEIDTTHMAVPTLDEVTSNRQKIPAGIAGIKDMTLVFHFDPAVGLPPINAPEETIQLILKRRPTESTPAVFSATGFFKDATLNIPIEGKMLINSVVAFSGAYTYTKPSLL